MSDLAFAAALFVVLFPVMALVAAAVYRPGTPLIVRRRCAARAGRGILLYEFNHPEIHRGEPGGFRAEPAHTGGPLHFLICRCRGDQLPQLVNVLQGELALFPSPYRASFLTD